MTAGQQASSTIVAIYQLSGHVSHRHGRLPVRLEGDPLPSSYKVACEHVFYEIHCILKGACGRAYQEPHGDLLPVDKRRGACPGLVEGVAHGRPPHRWLRRCHSRIWLAGWNAAVPPARWRAVGGAEQPDPRLDCPRGLLRQRGPHGFATWLR